MKRKIRKWIYSIFLLLLVSMSVSFGADTYYYFSGNGKNNNGFQQGCEEYYYVYYNLDGMDGITTTNIVVQLDNNDLHYYTGVLATGLQQNLFRKNNDVASSFTAGYPKWKNQFNKIDISTNFLSTAPNNTYLGYFIFKPTYRNGSYNSNVYLLWHDNDISLGKGGNNMVSYSEQVQHLTGTIPVKQSPCVDDGQSPRIINVNYTNGSSHIDRKKLEFDIKDDNTTQVGTGAVPYIWNKNGQNLVWTSHNNQNINNQIGVLDTTVTVKVTGKGLDGTSYTNRNANVTCNGKGILAWTGGWERDYGCEVTAADLLPQEFGVEEPITITISGKDRLNHQTGTSITFNSPVQPDIKDWTLTNGVYPNKNDNSNRYGIDSQIRFTVKDDWAGVDSGSIVVKITGTGGYSKIFTGNIDTGNISLTISNGSEGKGHAAWYDVVVTLTPDEYLPVDDKITVNVSFKDFVNQTRSRSRYFYTRKSCAALGCCDGTEIYTGFENSHISFTGEELFISGGNNIEVTTGNITYFGNIFTGGVLINCNYVGLTLFKGTPENNPTEVASVPYNRLVFTGGDNVVKGVLSGNVLTLKYYVQDTNVNIISPNVGNGLSGEYLVDDNGYTTTGIFTWELADGTDSSQWLSGYDFVVYSGNEFGNDEVYSGRIYTTGTTISFTGSEYVRGVRAVDNQGNTGEWATGSFKIKYRLACDNLGLDLIKPTQAQEFTNSRQVRFEWSLSGGEGVGDMTYRLQIWEDGTNVLDGITTEWISQTGIETSLENGNYNWRVIANDSYGHNVNSNTGTFSVNVNGLAGLIVVTPENISGEVASLDNNGNYLSGNMYMQWHSNKDEVSGVGEFTGFDLAIYSGTTCGAGTPIWTGSTGKDVTRMEMPVRLGEGDYCWQIQAVVMSGSEKQLGSASGLVFNVRNPYCTKNGQNLELRSPINNAQLYTSSVTLIWSGEWDNCLSSSTSGYRVELYTGDESDPILITGVDLKAESLSVDNLGAASYRWRVQMVDDVKGEWETGSFEIIALLDPGAIINTNFALNLVKPVSGTTYNDGNVEFEWYATGQGVGTLKYQIDVYTGELNNTNSSTHITGASDLSTTGFTANLDNGTYWWKVRVSDEYENSSEAFTGYFTVSLEQTYTVKVKTQSNSKELGYIAFYSGCDHTQLPAYTGVIVVDFSGGIGTGIYTGNIEAGTYEVVFQSWKHLAAALSGVEVGGANFDGILDFTTGNNVTGLKNGKLIEGDVSPQGGTIAGIGITSVYGSECLGGNKTVEGAINIMNLDFDEGKVFMRCDMDGSKIVNANDIAQIITNMYDEGIYTKGYSGLFSNNYIQYLDLLN